MKICDLREDRLKRFCYYVVERNRIYKNKEILNRPRPYSDDPIFRQYRFTNVKRWQDRESRWLIRNICMNPDLSYRDKIIDCILFRSWNKSKTMEILGGPWREEDLCRLDDGAMRDRIAEFSKMNPDYAWYTGAFNTGGFKRLNRDLRFLGKTGSDSEERCIPFRVFILYKKAERNEIFRKIESERDPVAVYSLLLSIDGFASFLAYQVFVDLTYIPESPFSEDDLFVAGPGCKKGMSYLTDIDMESIKNKKLIEDLAVLIHDDQDEIFRGCGYSLDDEFDYLPARYRSLTYMDIENIFCEFSKISKVWEHTGRPRVRYDRPDRFRSENDVDQEWLIDNWMTNHYLKNHASDTIFI